MSGVNILEEAKLVNLADKMKTGEIENLLQVDNGILLGHGLANKLNAHVGDLVTLASPKGTTMSFRVVGTFQFGIGSLDNIKSYVSLKNVQQLMGKDNQYITDINIKMKDYTTAKTLAATFGAKYGYKSEDWETANASAMISITIRNMMTIVVSFTLLVVAGFGIYNIMTMTIQNKLKDIAILKAEGSRQGISCRYFIPVIDYWFLGCLDGLGFGVRHVLWGLEPAFP